MSAGKVLNAVIEQRVELGILGTVISLISLLLCMVLDHLINTTTLSGRKMRSACARCLSVEYCVIAWGTRFDNL